MNFGNCVFELAELRSEQEREAAIVAARKAVTGQGAIDCEACGEEIEPARRVALPSAKRCITCQARLERRTRRRA